MLDKKKSTTIRMKYKIRNEMRVEKTRNEKTKQKQNIYMLVSLTVHFQGALKTHK